MVMPSAEQFALNDLPKHSEWPERILGEVDWTVPDRNLEKVIEEYEKDKYKNLLSFQNSENIKNPKDIKRKQLLGREWQFSESNSSEPHVVISQNSNLYLAPVLETQWYNDEVLCNTFEDILNGGETVIELGSGYGYNLHVLKNEYPNCTFIGGEISENARMIASNLYKDSNSIGVRYFNYYDEDWDIFDREFENDVVIFTRLSIEQLPKCKQVINKLLTFKKDLKTVIHLEPVYDMCREDDLLGLLRRKYIEINDYNRDLFTVLEEAEDIEIDDTMHDVFGDNGLCPMSLIQWHPK